jgi:membrane protein
MEPVTKVIHELRQPQGGLLSFGAIAALWTASAAVRALMTALNKAYEVRETRPAWKLYPLSIVYTIGLAAMLITAAALFAIGPRAMEWLAHWFGLEQLIVVVWTWLRWPVVLVIFSMAIAIVYYVGPNVKQDFSLISPGAILSVVVWLLATVAFDFYLGSFADYNATYGSIGTIVVLLLYFYLTASVLLFGAEINAAIAREVPGMAIKPPDAEMPHVQT